MTRISVVHTERGFELAYSYHGGPFACGPEEESATYANVNVAIAAARQEVGEIASHGDRAMFVEPCFAADYEPRETA